MWSDTCAMDCGEEVAFALDLVGEVLIRLSDVNGCDDTEPSPMLPFGLL